jgi:ferrous iron transport protein B
MHPKPLTVALVGNPNTGKSTLFNALSGLRQHVGNYPGVTVEMKRGHFYQGETRVELIDLPGTYSLAPRSPDEVVAVDLLLGRRPEEPRPDVVLAIVDASNLDRHLYLTTQVMELGVPVVLAVNMVDVAATQGIRVDVETLSRATGLPAVAVQANRGVGLDTLRAKLVAAAGGTPPTPPPLPAAVDAEAETVRAGLNGELPPFLARRAVLDVGGSTERWLVAAHGEAFAARLAAARQRLADGGTPVPAAEAKARYGWIRKATAAAVTKPAVRPVTRTDRLDRVLTHKVWGTLLFLLVMFGMFQSIFVFAKPLMEWIDAGRGWLAEWVTESLPPGPVRGLIADGVLKGVGGVLVFLPQILILFLFIAVLEDCGYMARAAFLMDRLMSRCGLSGKSFIPMLSSVACAVPGVMATRVIEDRRDRLATILVAPLMSCSARLPVYLLFIGTFLRDGHPGWLPGLVLFAMYLIGFVAAPLVALALKRTLLRGDTPLFVMELPAYKRPSARAILRRMADAGWAFVRRAGTVILAAMVLIWAALYFPNKDAAGERYEDRVAAIEAKAETADEGEKEKLEAERDALVGEWRRNSVLGTVGRWIEPAVRPLGWDWKIGLATLASFPAREVLVGTFGLIYDRGEVDTKAVGDPDDEKAGALRRHIREEWSADPIRGRYAVPVALSVMVFFALCIQCVSTLAVIRRETRSWRWPLFTFAYMTALAYLGALVTFQVGRLVTDWVT